MLMRRFFPYFGSKWRSIPHYPAPLHDTIIEPFAGAAGYAVRHHEARVLLSDPDVNIATVWQYLIQVEADEIMGLPLIDEFDRVDELDVSDGAKALIGFWINPGSAAPRNVPTPWCYEYMHISPGSLWSAPTRERIASQVDKIRHWRIVQEPYKALGFDLEATWFIDPPYQTAGKHYRHSAIDYDHLGAWCRSRSGQVIVCENEGATWLPFRTLASVHAMNGRTRSGVSHEVIWTPQLERV